VSRQLISEPHLWQLPPGCSCIQQDATNPWPLNSRFSLLTDPQGQSLLLYYFQCDCFAALHFYLCSAKSALHARLKSWVQVLRMGATLVIFCTLSTQVGQCWKTVGVLEGLALLSFSILYNLTPPPLHTKDRFCSLRTTPNVFLFCFIFWDRSCLNLVLLLQPPGCWDYRWTSPHSTGKSHFHPFMLSWVTGMTSP
jgi:hypothetical protein